MAEGMLIRDFCARLLSLLNPNAMDAHPETALAAQPLTLSAAVGALTDAALTRDNREYSSPGATTPIQRFADSKYFLR